MSTSGQRERSAAITGAGSGLGRDIALGLAAKGYRVFGTALSCSSQATARESTKQMRRNYDIHASRGERLQLLR